MFFLCPYQYHQHFTHRMIYDFEFKKSNEFISFDKDIRDTLQQLQLEKGYIESDDIDQMYVKIFKFGIEKYGLGLQDCNFWVFQDLVFFGHEKSFKYLCSSSILKDGISRIFSEDNFGVIDWAVGRNAINILKYIFKHFKSDIPDNVLERALWRTIDSPNNLRAIKYLFEIHKFTGKAINKAIQHCTDVQKEKLLEEYLGQCIKYNLLEFFQTKIQQKKHKLLIQALEHEFWAYPEGIRYRELLFKNKN